MQSLFFQQPGGHGCVHTWMKKSQSLAAMREFIDGMLAIFLGVRDDNFRLLLDSHFLIHFPKEREV